MVRDRGLEPLTPSVSRKCSTSELTAHRNDAHIDFQQTRAPGIILVLPAPNASRICRGCARPWSKTCATTANQHAVREFWLQTLRPFVQASSYPATTKSPRSARGDPDVFQRAAQLSCAGHSVAAELRRDNSLTINLPRHSSAMWQFVAPEMVGQSRFAVLDQLALFN